MKNQKGFSLLEVLIAIVVFALGILAVGNMQITAIKGNSTASTLTQASTIAQSKIEELMNVSYNDQSLVDTDGDGTNQDTDNDGVDDQGPDYNFGLNDSDTTTADHADPRNPIDGKYSVYWNVAVDSLISGTKTISLIVTWDEGGRQRQVSFTTRRTNI